MNLHAFTGRLTEDPELRVTTTNKSVITTSIATTRGFGANKKTVFPQIVFWGTQADYIHDWAKKGTMIEVECEYDETFYSNSAGKKIKVCQFVSNKVKIISNSNDSENVKSENYNESFPFEDDGIPKF